LTPLGDQGALFEQVENLAVALAAPERASAERVVELCRALVARPRDAGKLVPSPLDPALKKELARLSEVLGRRASRALPAAALARAALAELSGDARGREAACDDCRAKLALWGL
jgi:hypothetical protein